MDRKHLKEALEALFFVWEEPLTAEIVAPILELSLEEAEELLKELASDFSEAERGIEIRLLKDGYRMGTRPDLAIYVEKLFSRETVGNLSKPAFETLAIIAYKQPVTRAEVEAIRGVSSDSPIESLIKRKLICVNGRKDSAGKPRTYGTTPEFLNYFGLKSLNDLPELKKDLN